MRQRLSIGMGRGKNAYMPRMLPSETSVLEPNELRTQVSNLNLVELNWALFRCEAEERVEEPYAGAYDIPDFGKLCYCGFQVSFKNSFVICSSAYLCTLPVGILEIQLIFDEVIGLLHN